MKVLSLIVFQIFYLSVLQAHASAAIVRQQQQQQIQQQAYQEQIQQKQIQQAQQRGIQRARQNAGQPSEYPSRYQDQTMVPKTAEEVVDLKQVWRELEYSSEIWPLIIDRQPKEITIREYVNLFRQKGVTIKKPASYYVDFIDQMLNDRPDLLNSPFKDVLQFAAIIEYDFDNGQNKDQMALRLLGQQVFEENKRRLGY